MASGNTFLLVFLLILPYNILGFALKPLSPPVLGIGALFRPRGTTIRPSSGDEDTLVTVGKFFTESFWTNKVGGGAKTLTPTQTKSLTQQQILEFRRRYGITLQKDRKSELLVCRNSNQDIMGCAGIEVDLVPTKGKQYSQKTKAPVMSNLAVGKQWRRKGLAELLVEEAENLARKQWGYDECYLYVEKRNKPAVKLYRKLGYKPIWEDEDAKTLLPTEGGKVKNAPTVILCMKKNLGGGLLGRLLPF